MSPLTPNSSFSIAIRLTLANKPGTLAKVTQAIADLGGNLSQIELLSQTKVHTLRHIAVDAYSSDHADQIIQAVQALPDIQIQEITDRTFAAHVGGKLEIIGKRPLDSNSELAMVYTPGVGRVSSQIAQAPETVYTYTMKGNTVGIVTDGSAVLGLGNIGPEAALPVMEGKAALFKRFAGIDAFPICLATQDTEAIVQTVINLAPGFGGFNLEDISAPRCFEIETRLKQHLAMPIFHDDQHGTAIVVLAALLNALRVVNKPLNQVTIVLNGAGAAGIAVINLLKQAGAQQVIACDRTGIISHQRSDLTPQKAAVAVAQTGSLADALVGADVFIGVSVKHVLTVEMVEQMATHPVIFALANPIPEIQPELIQGIVGVMATGRSDYPNQINNVLAFPGVFRGALDCRAKEITTDMGLAAAQAIAALVAPADLGPDCIIPTVFDERVVPAVASAVEKAAREAGIAQLD